MQKPVDYDQISIGGDFRPLPPGGYVCKIIGAEERINSSGGEMLVVALDIIEGEYEGYFMDLFNRNKASNTDPNKTIKYPHNGTAYVNVFDSQGRTKKTFKGLVTSVEEGGRNVIWGEGFCRSLIGAEVGVLFGREEWIDMTGASKWATKPFFFRNPEKIRLGDFRVPEDRPAKREDKPSYPTYTQADFGDSFQAAEDDIPF